MNFEPSFQQNSIPEIIHKTFHPIQALEEQRGSLCEENNESRNGFKSIIRTFKLEMTSANDNRLLEGMVYNIVLNALNAPDSYSSSSLDITVIHNLVRQILEEINIQSLSEFTDQDIQHHRFQAELLLNSQYKVDQKVRVEGSRYKPADAQEIITDAIYNLYDSQYFKYRLVYLESQHKINELNRQIDRKKNRY